MSEPRWLDERESRAWRGFIDMSQLLWAQLARQLQEDQGLSRPDYEILVRLSEAEGHRVRMSELAGRMLWSKSRLSHQFSRMEARGLVRRESCPSDARGAFAALTPEGLEALRRAAPGHVEAVRRYLFDVLTDDEVDALADITAKVVRHLTACPKAPADGDVPPEECEVEEPR